jgi:hypothetical protein
VFDDMLKVRMENEKLPRFKRGEGERGTALSNTFFSFFLFFFYTNRNQWEWDTNILFYFNI